MAARSLRGRYRGERRVSTAARPAVDGQVETGFEEVMGALEDDLAGGTDGSACAVYVDGRKVVDIWGGLADPVTKRPWTDDTLCTIGSATKGLAAVCANLLADRGLLDPDARMADYWPEFA